MAAPLDPDAPFCYPLACSIAGCPHPPTHKVVASWSNGPLRELKNYGLACSEHRESLLVQAQGRRQGLIISDDELVGPVEAITLELPLRHAPE